MTQVKGLGILVYIRQFYRIMFVSTVCVANKTESKYTFVRLQSVPILENSHEDRFMTLRAESVLDFKTKIVLLSETKSLQL